MTLRRFTLGLIALPLTLLVAPAAHASAADSDVGSATCSASRERMPSPSSTIVPAVIVFAAIGATVARMNRRGGPR
jgi:hypothetical protein